MRPAPSRLDGIATRIDYLKGASENVVPKIKRNYKIAIHRPARDPRWRRAPAGSSSQAMQGQAPTSARWRPALAVLPFRSPHLRRSDGVASRIDWHPTQVHLRFLQLLRAEARRVAGGGRSGAQAA
jgi:hypothetical protein